METVSNAQASDGRTYPSRRRKSEAEASVALDGETVAIPPATTPVAVPDRVLGRMVADAADEFEERHGTGGSADDPEPWPGDDEEQDDLDEEVFVAGYEDEPAGDDAPAAPAFDDAPFDALFGKLVRFFDARANALGQTKSGHYRRTIDGMNDVARRFRSWQEVGK